MRIAAWNCRGGLRKKRARLRSLNFDIAVVSECAEGDASVVRWCGDRKKGLGIFAAEDVTVTLHSAHDERFQWFLPLDVSRGAHSLRVLAVWSMNHRGVAGPSKIPIDQALSAYESWLSEKPCVVLGDMNHGVRWDTPKPGAPGNFQPAIDRLGRLGLVSAYHRTTGEAFDQETRPTFLSTKGVPFHIDYAFLPAPWVDRGARLEVGDMQEWKADSDHAPLVLDIPDDILT